MEYFIFVIYFLNFYRFHQININFLVNSKKCLKSGIETNYFSYKRINLNLSLLFILIVEEEAYYKIQILQTT